MPAMILRKLRALVLIGVASLAILFSSCQICQMTKNCGDDGDCPGHARVCEKPTVRALAQDLDHLEAHIETYGSVAIQQPSVWGQARLTKHREDFEKEMAKELSNFNATLQGTLSRSDQAYFTNAFALSAAASGNSGGSAGSSSSSSSSAPANAADAGIPADAFGAFSNITRTPANLPALTGFSNLAKSGITLEPSTYLNQKARFLNHLSELRRLNEGDDTADSPGYALNLIRVPVSILPGKCTQHGHGAEVTMTLKPYLNDDLLPITFRNLVMNDLLEVIGVPLTQFLNDPDQLDAFVLIEELKKKESAPSKKNASASTNHSFQLDLVSSQGAVPGVDHSRPQIRQLSDLKQQSSKDWALDNATVKKQMIIIARQGKIPLPQAQISAEAFKQVAAKASNPSKILIPRLSASKAHRANRPFPPSQILDIFGASEAGHVAKIANGTLRTDPANKYWIHYPDVQGYLQEELAAAHRFLAESSRYQLWDYCNQDLVTAIHTRDIEKMANLRDKFSDEVLATSKQTTHSDVTIALAWTIIVESALLTEQLVQDMKESAAAKGCPCASNHWLPYYLPNPPAEARQAFNKYVECRWPIIVFALDPVADQQNIADTFAQRREMQLSMSLAFVNGNISAKNMMRYARRIESQMETVALNNTITGFSHGNETFGWRFYPRFQTPEIESNAKVFFRDLLIGDQSRDSQLKQRKLEPGQRECTAIVLMPSFVPYATVDVSSTWFKLANPKCKDMTCVDAVKLSARVRAIDKCADRVMDADCYRDGELERLKKRAKQLEARLPLQNMTVQVPYENTLGGFAMFNTGITDLAPELYGWYGAPAVDTTGSTTLFLIGNHFSVFQTRVLVGGVEATTELLSRQVMKVTIPKGAQTIDHDTGRSPVDPPKPAPQPANAKIDVKATFGVPILPGAAAKDAAPTPEAAPATDTAPAQDLFVDVHIATPYGVTSHLLIPALGKSSGQGGGTPAANQQANWTPNAIVVGYVSKGLGITASSPAAVRPSDLTIQLTKPVLNVNNADLTLTLSGGGTAVTADFTITGVSLSKQTLTLSSTARDAMIALLFDKLGPQYDKNLDPTKNSAKLSLKQITLKQDTAVVGTITLSPSADLTINWIAAHEEKNPPANPAGKAAGGQ